MSHSFICKLDKRIDIFLKLLQKLQNIFIIFGGQQPSGFGFLIPV